MCVLCWHSRVWQVPTGAVKLLDFSGKADEDVTTGKIQGR